MVPAVIVESRPLVGQHHPLGTSTGWMDHARADWPELVERALEVSTFAVELAALDEPEWPSLVAYLAARPPLPFRYLAVHAPTKNRTLAEADLVASLGALGGRVDGVVVHPDVIEDVERYRALGGLLVLENMDPRKEDGRTSEELERWFRALPEAGLCLDVAHAGAVDPDMGEAHRILDRFGARLRHLHVSSLDAACHHRSLDASDEARFASVLRRCQDVPWILEAPLP